MDNFEQPVDYITTTRLELQTQLSLMASFIYSSASNMTVEKAVDIAIEIRSRVDDKVKDEIGRKVVKVKEEKVQTNRLDLKTRICFMSSIIFASIDGITTDEAVEEAVAIENASDARVKRMKKENPVFPEDKQPEQKKTYTRPRAMFKDKRQPVQQQ